MRTYTILHAIETGGPGGAETVCLHLASSLDASRFRSLVVLPDDRWLNRELQQRGVRTVLSGARSQGTRAHIHTLRQLLRTENVDLIQSHLPDQNFFSAVAGSRSGCKTVVTYHGALDRGHAKARLKLWWVRRACAAAVGVSRHMVSQLAEAGFPSAKLHCIYNGVETALFRAAASGRLRRELGCAAEDKLVGIIANLRGSKGYEHFVQAARSVAECLPQARFLAVGETEPVLEQRLRRQLSEMGLESRFHLLGFRSDVPEILAELDVFVLSSTNEGFSIATVEAMAAGKPVVVTRSGGPQEIVEDGHTGILVPPADPAALAREVCALLKSPERAAALGAEARQAAERRFSLAAMVGEYERLYTQLLGI